MMIRSLSAVAVLLMTTSLAQAAFDAQSVAAQLQADGYTSVEIKVGQNIAKVEAIKGTTKIEVTYDIASGDVIKSETEQLEPGDDSPAAGDGRGHHSAGSDDDGPDHDVNDDHGGRGGDDDGPGHDANDDHGGASAGGSDDGPEHDADDDHGGRGHDGGDDDGGDDDHGGHSGHGGDDDHGGSSHGGDDGDDDHGGDDD